MSGLMHFHDGLFALLYREKYSQFGAILTQSLKDQFWRAVTPHGELISVIVID